MLKRLPLALLLPALLATPLRAADDPTAAIAQEPNVAYPLSKIVPTYTRADRDLPPLADLLKTTVTLAIVDNVLTAPTADHKGSPIPLEKLGAAPASAIDSSAIKLVYAAIIRFYNDHHVAAIYTVVDTHDISEEDRDLRKDRDTLTFLITAAHIVELHTARTVPNGPDKLDDPADAAILKNSPLQPAAADLPAAATDLLNKSLLSTYLASLAKTGLTVMPQLAQPEKPGEISLTYIITQTPAH